jgi:hypothetical protein
MDEQVAEAQQTHKTVNGRMRDEQRTVRVVYLAGDGRSGTTLLSRILGSYDGCLAVGELYDIWIEMLDGNKICSCGDPLHNCSFWNAVMEEAFGGVDRRTIEYVMALRSSVQSVRHVPFMLFPWSRPPAFNRQLREYVQVIERLYLAIHNVSGGQTIVDSSKLAIYAIALSESPVIDVNLLHVIRDSRACVYSWRRLKREHIDGDRERYLRQRSLFRSAVVWAMRNATLTWASRRFKVATTMRYEDFVRRPRSVMTAIVEFLGIDSHGVTWTHDDEFIALSTTHIFAGNPNRVERGAIRVRSDDEWRSGMAWRHRAMVSVLTLPVLWRLGYLGSGEASKLAPGPDMAVQEQT